MSQSLSFRESPNKTPRMEAFDQSLSSKSKLISMPHNVENKLIMKAADMEQ